jgi:hypothetical protein
MPVIMAWKKGARGGCRKFDASDDVSAWKVSAYAVRAECKFAYAAEFSEVLACQVMHLHQRKTHGYKNLTKM